MTKDNKNERTVAALGIFDGVHLGHRAVIDLAVRKARQTGAVPAVFTFDTGSVTSKGEIEPLITDLEKSKRLKALGIRAVYSSSFEKLRTMSAERFVDEILFKRLNAICAVCGEDFRFGNGGSANAEDLKRICALHGITVETIGQLKIGGTPVSSTRIRELLKSGEISTANELLGYKYTVSGEVIHGFARGRTIDFPTINQAFAKGLAIPRFGVYCSKVRIGNKEYAGVTNVGVKPTVEKDAPPLAETFIIDFEGDLYGRVLETQLYEFVRPERRFENIEELKAEITRNTSFAREYFGK